MKDFLSSLVCSFFVLSMILIATGCAKNSASMVPGEVPGLTSDQLEEKTIGGMHASRNQHPRYLVEDFLEASSPPDLSEFKPATDLSKIHFNYDNYTVRSVEESTMDNNASWLMENPATFVKIEGHCDERGTPDYNLALGERRANSTKDYLISLGIESSRILSVSYGKEKPFCGESKENCWAENRRAEFFTSK